MKHASIFAFVLATAVAAPTFARSSGLWTERPGSSTPLAQVPDLKALAAHVVPAVVSIQVEQTVKHSRGERSFFGNPFGPMPPEFGRGIGSGFVIRKDGLILTNYHVVEDAELIEVTLATADGGERTLEAEILGTAPKYDVALIKTKEDANAPVVPLGDSDAMDIGDWVVAVGNPYGLSHSVSVGIISAKQRRSIVPSGRQGLYDFIQTDASINPGNSGGPLINMRGEVVAINTAINSRGQGIGFAIPINMVKTMLPELKAKGRFTRSWIGIKIQPLTDELAQSYGLDSARGALVTDVVPNSPGEEAGLKEGDIVLEFDNKLVRDSSDLPLFASMAGVGKHVALKVWRDARESAFKLRLAEFPAELAGGPSSRHERGALGLVVADITPTLQREFRLNDARGVVIREIEPGSIAHTSGLRPGDVVLTLNGKPVRTARTFAKTVNAISSGGVMRMKIKRADGKLFLAVKKP